MRVQTNADEEIASILDNPLTHIYESQHPEIMEKAKEYQYLSFVPEIGFEGRTYYV